MTTALQNLEALLEKVLAAPMLDGHLVKRRDVVDAIGQAIKIQHAIDDNAPDHGAVLQRIGTLLNLHAGTNLHTGIEAAMKQPVNEELVVQKFYEQDINLPSFDSGYRRKFMQAVYDILLVTRGSPVVICEISSRDGWHTVTVGKRHIMFTADETLARAVYMNLGDALRDYHM